MRYPSLLFSLFLALILWLFLSFFLVLSSLLYPFFFDALLSPILLFLPRPQSLILLHSQSSSSSSSFNAPYLSHLCFAPSYHLSLPRSRALLHSFTFVSLLTSLFLDTLLIPTLPFSSLISSSSLFRSSFFPSTRSFTLHLSSSLLDHDASFHLPFSFIFHPFSLFLISPLLPFFFACIISYFPTPTHFIISFSHFSLNPQSFSFVLSFLPFPSSYFLSLFMFLYLHLFVYAVLSFLFLKFFVSL